MGLNWKETEKILSFGGTYALFTHFCVFARFAGEGGGDAGKVVFGGVEREMKGKFLPFFPVFFCGASFVAPFFQQNVTEEGECRRGKQSEEHRRPERLRIETENAEKEQECRAEDKKSIRPEGKFKFFHVACRRRVVFCLRFAAGRRAAVLIFVGFSFF